MKWLIARHLRQKAFNGIVFAIFQTGRKAVIGNYIVEVDICFNRVVLSAFIFFTAQAGIS